MNTNQSIMLHTGANRIDRSILSTIPTPLATDTWKPISHEGLLSKICTMANDLLRYFTKKKEILAVNRQGQQFFFMIQYEDKNNPEHLLAIAGRNSHDQSFSLGFAIGVNVFICDNLAISGDIAILRKHTTNIWNDIESILLTNLYKANEQFLDTSNQLNAMRQITMKDQQAASTLGILYHKGVLSSRQFTEAHKQWINSEHDDFKARTLYSFYNACTEALKSTPPGTIMQMHQALHMHLTSPARWEL